MGRRELRFEHKIELKRRKRIIRNPSSDLRNYSFIGPLTNEDNLRAKKTNNFSLFQTSDDRGNVNDEGRALEGRSMR